jgi:hypothetical protein
MIIYLEDKRRDALELVPKVQHLMAGVPLMWTGLHNLTAGEAAERPMAILEIAVAAIVFFTFLKDVYAARRHRHSHKHPSVGWFDLAAGGLLIFEAFHGAHLKPGYLRPQFLAGVATIVTGVFHSRLHARKARRRYMKVDDAGLEFRLAFFRRIRVGWSDLDSVDLSGPDAIIRRKDGRRHKIALKYFHNGAAVRQGLAEHTPAALLTA